MEYGPKQLVLKFKFLMEVSPSNLQGRGWEAGDYVFLAQKLLAPDDLSILISRSSILIFKLIQICIIRIYD